jgi:hypothetical protein
VFVDVGSSTLPTQCGLIRVYAPNDYGLSGGCVVDGKGYVDRTVLPTTGTYRIVIDPDVRNTGQAEVRLATITDQQTPITVNGPAVAAAVGQPGAISTLSFAGTAGEKVKVTVTAATLQDECGVVGLVAPGGNVLTFGCIVGGTGSVDVTTLPTTGQYRIVIDPHAYNTGTAQVRLQT